MTLAILFNMEFVPFSIAFDYDAEGFWLGLNIFAIFIYLLDMLVQTRTAIQEETTGNLIVDKQKIWACYVNKKLFYDILFCVPWDYIAYLLQASNSVCAYVRILRLFKVKRAKEFIKIVKQNSKKKMALTNMLVYFITFIYLNHYLACCFFLIGSLQH